MLHILLSSSLFSREFAGFTGLEFKAIRGRAETGRETGGGRCENLSGVISGLTFSRAVIGAGNSQKWRFVLSEKAEELSLFNPAGRQPRRLMYQCLGGESRRFSAFDDGSGQPGKTQKGIEVGST
jgi:hypothetical protein